MCDVGVRQACDVSVCRIMSVGACVRCTAMHVQRCRRCTVSVRCDDFRCAMVTMRARVHGGVGASLCCRLVYDDDRAYDDQLCAYGNDGGGVSRHVGRCVTVRITVYASVRRVGPGASCPGPAPAGRGRTRAAAEAGRARVAGRGGGPIDCA